MVEYGQNSETLISEIESGVKTPEIKRIVRPLLTLIQNLAPNINTGAYSCVISDDISGRIPAEVIYRIITLSYQRLGFGKALFLKIRGGSPIQDAVHANSTVQMYHAMQMEKDMYKAAPLLKKLPGDKTILLVTEFIDQGFTVDSFTKRPELKGRKLDIAAVSLNKPTQYYTTNNRIPPNTNLFYGQISKDKSSLWNKPELTGHDPDREESATGMPEEIQKDVDFLTAKLKF